MAIEHYNEVREFGSVRFVRGEARGKFPSINFIYVRDRGETAVLDPGSNVHVISQLLADGGVDRVILSHYHNDHIRYLDRFEGVPTHLHESEVALMSSMEELAKAHELANSPHESIWRERMERERGVVSWPIEHPYRDGETIQIAGEEIEFIHTPGHSWGHTCIRFIQADVIYLADIDLTRFGPWYGNATSDLEDFIASIDKIRDVEAAYYLTAHEAGAVDRPTFLKKLAIFRVAIDERDERILKFLDAPHTLAEVVNSHPAYLRQFQPAILFNAMEGYIVQLHLDRLIRLGRVEEVEGEYRRISG